MLHTLAEPNLTAISGETANFLAGGEFPIPVAQQLGTISVEFKKFGIGLAFTPVVMSEGRISLKVSTEVSELSNEGAVVLSNITIPALKVRRAETVVELPSGGSLVMAGLLSDQSKQALSGYPGLKKSARPRHAVQEPRLSEERDRARCARHALRGEAGPPLKSRAT